MRTLTLLPPAALALAAAQPREVPGESWHHRQMQIGRTGYKMEIDPGLTCHDGPTQRPLPSL